MTQFAFDIDGGSASVDSPRVAARSAGGLFALVKSEVATPATAVLYRLDAAGAVVWSIEITLPSGNYVQSDIAVACGSTYVAVLIRSSDATVTSHVALLNESDGSEVWQITVPLFYDAYLDTNFTQGIAVTSVGDVFVVGRPTSAANADQNVCKLASADGSLTWIQNVREAAQPTSNDVLGVVAMSGGDAVVTSRDPTSAIGIVQRLDGTSGALVWTRTFSFPFDDGGHIACVDPSDNVYIASGRSTNFMSVAKLNSSGATQWSKDVTSPDGASYVTVTGGIAADASNVYVGAMYTDGASTYQHPGLIVVDSAGSSVTMPMQISPTAYTDGAESVSVNGGSAYFTSYRKDGSFFNQTVVYEYDGTAGGDIAAYTGGAISFSRAAQAVSIGTGTAVIATTTPTLDTATSITVSAGAMTYGAESLTETLYTGTPAGGGATIRFAYSLHPTAHFGLPSWANAHLADSTNTTQFGTPAVDYNLEPAAHSLGPTARLGVPYAAIEAPLGPRAAYQIGFQTTAFGSPTAAIAGQYAQPSTDPSTHFGAATARVRQPVTTIGVTTTFGTVGAALRQRPSAVHSTAFGTPVLGNITSPSGFLATKFGTPRAPGAIYGRYYDLDGFQTSRFGTAKARMRQPATTIGLVSQFGAPRETSVPHAAGFKPTAFGLAQANFTLQASGFESGDFGTPRAPGAVLGRGGLGYGFRNTRFGAPRSLHNVSTSVGGFDGTTFGTPAVAQGHLARSIRPGTRFAAPAVARTCP